MFTDLPVEQRLLLINIRLNKLLAECGDHDDLLSQYSELNEQNREFYVYEDIGWRASRFVYCFFDDIKIIPWLG